MIRKTLLPLLSPLLLALLPVAAHADTITGQVVDEHGVGVPGVDIDVKNLGSGGTPPIFNDGTDANGFFTTTLPAGLYRVTFTPPPPPATTNLVLEVDDVIVVGSTAMGVVELPPGVALAGRALDPLGLPVAGINIDVIDAAGDNLTLAGDATDVFGEFAVAVPAGAVELRLDTKPVLGQTLAPRALALDLSGHTDLGDLALEAGFRVSGTVLGPVAVPVEAADFDAVDAATGEELYTPGDDTDDTGAFSFVVPARSLDLVVCPQFGDRLVAVTLTLTVAADTVLPTVVLEAGSVLSGTVRSFDGTPVPGADVDATRSDGTPVTLCADNAGAAGAYAVVVPNDTLSIEFEPPGFALPLGVDDHPAVVVAGNTLLDGSLPECPGGTVAARGVSGAGSFAPHLATSGGAPRAGNPGFAIEATGGLAGAPAVLFVGPDPLVGATPLRNAQFPVDGFLVGDPGRNPLLAPVLLSGPPGTPGAGAATFPMTVDGSMVGTTAFARLVVQDPAAPSGLAKSDLLAIAFCE